MKRVLLAAGFIMLTYASMAFATEEAGIAKTIGTVGAHPAGAAYFNFIEGFKDATLYNVVYIDLSTAGGRAAFEIVKEAKKNGMKINRVIYNTAPTGISMLELISTQ